MFCRLANKRQKDYVWRSGSSHADTFPPSLLSLLLIFWTKAEHLVNIEMLTENNMMMMMQTSTIPTLNLLIIFLAWRAFCLEHLLVNGSGAYIRRHRLGGNVRCRACTTESTGSSA